MEKEFALIVNVFAKITHLEKIAKFRIAKILIKLIMSVLNAIRDMYCKMAYVLKLLINAKHMTA
jgi:hypothetical protein